ncbi:hypothetical protein Salat_1660500 [Sesamum alatum]|uniref:Uncharacterized protein n=1 Tax=Sesamum alatum TaxID=300844 RepID=A0AAE2CJX2_9LAMI|nr:hypothetical protein Salat_1660500 [Sesamum alatum]
MPSLVIIEALLSVEDNVSCKLVSKWNTQTLQVLKQSYHPKNMRTNKFIILLPAFQNSSHSFKSFNSSCLTKHSFELNDEDIGLHVLKLPFCNSGTIESSIKHATS